MEQVPAPLLHHSPKLRPRRARKLLDRQKLLPGAPDRLLERLRVREAKTLRQQPANTGDFFTVRLDHLEDLGAAARRSAEDRQRVRTEQSFHRPDDGALAMNSAAPGAGIEAGRRYEP